MINKFTVLIAGFLLLLLYTSYTLHPIFAQNTACPSQSPNPRVQNGLISANTVSNKFSNPTGQCATGNQTSFAPFKIPSYADLKSLYYTQSKSSSKQPTSISSLPSFSGDGIYTTSTNLTISASPTGSGTEVIFVEGNLTIGPMASGTQFNYGSGNSGIVFVVQGDVNIAQSVTQIDAVIISSGIIRTAGSTCTQNSYDASTTGALTINGSLISLNQTNANPIVFCRALLTTNNHAPAEQINQQPKYLVILRDLFSDTLQKWSEIQ